MKITCPKCAKSYSEKDESGGNIAFCPDCGAELILPIPNPTNLLSWAKQVEWEMLQQFVNKSGAKGHDIPIIDQLDEIYCA